MMLAQAIVFADVDAFGVWIVVMAVVYIAAIWIAYCNTRNGQD